MLELPQIIDQPRVRAYRLQRTRELLAQFNMDAAVLFDPLNLRYATGCRNMQVWTSHHQSRYVFVPVEGSVGGDEGVKLEQPVLITADG